MEGKYQNELWNLLFSDEINCMDLFEGENPREKILVFEIVQKKYTFWIL